MLFPRFVRSVARVLLLAFVSLSLHIPGAQAKLISTETALAAEQSAAVRDRIKTLAQRDDVREYLQARGVSTESISARVDALTDAEVEAIATRLDQLPAGGNDIIGALVFIFIVLLITDILGLTDIFPFVKKHRR